MPFGLQTKGLVVGILLAMFVIPWLLSMLGKGKPAAARSK